MFWTGNRVVMHHELRPHESYEIVEGTVSHGGTVSRLATLALVLGAP
jgi:hypothetical protein